MTQYWLASQDEEKKEALSLLERQIELDELDAMVHKDVALASACGALVMAALAAAGEYVDRRWGAVQDIESVIGGFALSISLLEYSLMRKSKKWAEQSWQEAAQIFISEDSE
jgi:hypothetical protein